MTDGRIARVEPSYLHVCHAVMTEVEAQGLDPSHLHPDRWIVVGMRGLGANGTPMSSRRRGV
jgi:hypothetical protein